MASVTLIELESGRTGYGELVRAVRRQGVKRSPRGQATYDAGHVVIDVKSPYDALPLGVGRSLNPAIAAAEAVQLIAGRARHDLLPRITSAFDRYAEPSGRFHGAYGDRIGAQANEQLNKLKKDRDTRQAVVTLWNPKLDNWPGRRDYPCTVALNFAIDNDRLTLRTLMRSNDVWLGLPYDVFQFTQLLLTAARALDVEPGAYTHETWSLHIYEQHAEMVDQLHDPVDPAEVDPMAEVRKLPWGPMGFGLSGMSWLACQHRADTILAGDDFRDEPLTASERWYVDRLERYLTPAPSA